MKTILKWMLALLTVMFFSMAVSSALSVNPLWMAGGLMIVLFAKALARRFLWYESSGVGFLAALVAYDPCTIALGTFTQAADCMDEGSGILGMYLVKKGFDLNTIIDQTTLTTAKTGLNVIPIKDIEAYWPKATQVTIPGLAGRMERHGRWEYEMPFKHEGVDANLKFWNTVNFNKNYGLVFVTEEYKAFAPLDRQLEAVLAKISAAPASDQEFGKTRFFDGNIKWKQRDLVQILDLFTVSMMKADFQP